MRKFILVCGLGFAGILGACTCFHRAESRARIPRFALSPFENFGIESGVGFPDRFYDHRNDCDLVLGKVTNAKTEHKSSHVVIVYTESVIADYRKWFRPGRKIEIRGMQNIFTQAAIVPREFDIPTLRHGEMWLTAVVRKRGRRELLYDYELLPIGVLVPIKVPPKSLGAARGAVKLMSHYMPKGIAAVPVGRRLGMNLLKSRHYYQWAFGCSILSAGGNYSLLFKMLGKRGFLVQHPKRSAWLIYLLSQRRAAILGSNGLENPLVRAVAADLLSASPYLRRDNPGRRKGRLARVWANVWSVAGSRRH